MKRESSTLGNLPATLARRGTCEYPAFSLSGKVWKKEIGKRTLSGNPKKPKTASEGQA
jgi:hypothetical protein